MKNHGNYVASLSQLGRWLAEQAEEAGATILPETSATKLLVSTAACAACGPAIAVAAATARSSPNFEPGVGHRRARDGARARARRAT